MTPMAIEKWTPEKRKERTRTALLDAAVEVFVKRGFNAASLDEIAETAGYTRGAIYKHFESKEDLFFAVNERINEQSLEEFGRRFTDLTATAEHVHEIVSTWRDLMSSFAGFRIIGMEFLLYVLRNPDVQKREQAQREKTRKLVAEFMEARAEEAGIELSMPAETLARIFLTTSDGFAQAALFDPAEADAYEAFLTLMMQVLFKPPE